MEILYKSEILPKSIEENIVEDSKKKFVPITSYTLVNGNVDGYFYKKINMEKVKERYSGNYAELLIEYYHRLKKLVNCNQLFEIFCDGDSLFEISNLLDNDRILSDNISVSYEEIKNLFIAVLYEIEKMEFYNDINLGIDSAIWNFTIDGVFFDFDPPKILKGDSLFTTKSEDYIKRVMYRNFNYNGMRANALGTIFLGNSNWNFSIKNAPENYAEELVTIFINSLKNEKDYYKNSIYGNKEISDFSKHPINILRRELRKWKNSFL